MSHVSHQTADLLFEIGTEELPAAYLPSLIEQLAAEAGTLLADHHLSFKQIRSLGTPRRLVLIVQGLSGVQRKPAQEIRGPSRQVSYDDTNKPTQALLGFLRSQGGTLKHTKLVTSDKGEYVYLVKPPTTTPTATILMDALPQLIGTLRSPKTMRWDESGLRFARPIRWILALYGLAPIPCTIGRLTGEANTWVGGPKQPRPLRVASVDGYLKALTRARILLEPSARRHHIEQLVEKTAARSHGSAAPEMVAHGLLDEVTNLVEQPVSMKGSFDTKYLALPREVLLASMAKYQRVFAIESNGLPAAPPPASRRSARAGAAQAGLPAAPPPASLRSAQAGKLLPRFVGILEGSPKRLVEVRAVFERILNARLADSLMFWNEDHAQLPLERMAGGLSGVTFHETLGSMVEKTLRLRGLTEPLAESWKLTDEERHHLRRACQLSKADLVSAMVKEFPTLQGVVGKHYALDSGEPQAVAEAIEEHYLPTGTRLPQTLLGGALAVLDKYDTLTSYFGLGIVPSGDQDPFGLRRAAQGIVEAAWAVHRPLPLNLLWRARVSMEPFRTLPPKEAAGVAQRVQRYLFERLYTFEFGVKSSELRVRGSDTQLSTLNSQLSTPSSDCITAVLASPCEDLIDAMDRIISLQQLSGHPALLKAAKVVERTRNILKGSALRQPQVDPSRLQEPLERQLWDLYDANHQRLVGLASEKSYGEATTLFGELFYEPLHAFFDRVLVNVPEESLQQNRLALMKAINTLYTERIADLSKLTILEQGRFQ